MRPSALFIAADGPRADHADEVDRCEAARKVATSVDWPCELHTLYRDRNLGCAVSVSTAISWFFEAVEQGIILEDDCVPNRSFYRFCTDLLVRYRAEPRVMHISGTSFQYGHRRGSSSYYFSKYPNIWGWASWKSAWQQYDFNLRPSWRLHDTWDTQWQLSIENARGLAVVPSSNLVRNIGFGAGATHTRDGERAATLRAVEISFPLRHPSAIRAHRVADSFTYYVHHRQVRYPALIPMYEARDWARVALKSIKLRIVQGPRRAAPEPEGAPTATPVADAPALLKHKTKRWLKGVRVPIMQDLIHHYFGWRRAHAERARYDRWVEAGRRAPSPPHHKQSVVRDAGRRFAIAVLIETGTFEGQMLEAVSRDFRRIFTIELDASLSARAAELFRYTPRITVLQGDSREVLPRVLKDLGEPAVFWLDAHFSGGATAGDADESPIMQELHAIASHPFHSEHVILIDDAREFTGGAYPTLAAVREWARASGYDNVQVQDDIIKIYRTR